MISYNGLIDINHSPEIISLTHNNNALIKTKFDRVEIHKDDGTYLELNHEEFKAIKYGWLDNENNLWIADSINGVLKFTNYEYQESFVPEGPNNNDIYSVEFLENQLFLSHGGHFNYGQNNLNKTGASIMQNNYSLSIVFSCEITYFVKTMIKWR